MSATASLPLVRSETAKLWTVRSTWILALVTILGTWAMAWPNAASGVGLQQGDPRLFSATPVPVEYQGFDMAGFGSVLVVALAALWAGSEHGSGRQLRTTLLATPQRLRVFAVKALLLAVTAAAVGFVTMWGTLVITHAAGQTGVSPWMLTPETWASLGGVTFAWTLSALVAFAIGMLARTAIFPLILFLPLAIGLGDLLAQIWEPARYLPVVAGAAMYTDPAAGAFLAPVAGGLVQAAWAVGLLFAAAAVFVRRDL